MIRILIADDHSVVRQGLKQILEEDPELKVVAECANGGDALDWLCNHYCDIALVDIAMPGMGGIEFINQLVKKKQKLPVLVLSIFSEDQYAVRLIRAGASGYLNKECAPKEIVKAVRCVASGKKYISPAVAGMLATEFGTAEGKPPHETLSDREFQIFLMLASANTVAGIAEALALSVKTISTYRTRVLVKMHLHNNAEIMRYAIDNNLLQ